MLKFLEVEIKFIGFLLFHCLILSSCSDESVKSCTNTRPLPLEYAQGFSLKQSTSHIEISFKQLSKKICLEKNQKKEQLFAVDSTSMVPWIEELGLKDSFVAMMGKRYLFDLQKFPNLVELGENLKIEELLKLKVSLFFVSSKLFYETWEEKLRAAGVTVIPIFDYLEAHPLARPEWMKVMSVFFSRLEKSSAIFKQKVKNYLELKKRVNKQGPKVLVGQMRDGLFLAPSGDSYLAHLLKDAGGTYILNALKGHETKMLKKEEILSLKYDMYLPQNHQTLKELKKQMRPVSLKGVKIYNNSARMGQNGGNDYWQRGVNSPDLLLKDLMMIFQSAKLPDHKLQWYQRLQ